MPETRRPGPDHHPDHRRGDGSRPARPAGRRDAGPRPERKAPEARAKVPDLSELKAEDFETLRRHPFFVDFEEGMWLYYKDNIGDGKSEEEQKADFEKLCEENIRKHSEYLLKNGELADWENFLKGAKTEGSEPADEDKEVSESPKKETVKTEEALTTEVMEGKFDELKRRSGIDFDQDKYLRENDEGLRRLEEVLKALADLIGLETSNLNYVKLANHGALKAEKIRNIYFPLENLAYLKEQADDLKKIIETVAKAKSEGFRAGCALGDGPAVEVMAVKKEFMKGKFREFKNLTIRWNHSPQEILEGLNALDFSKVPVTIENL